MTSIKAKKDVLWSTPIQSRHDSGYGGHAVFGYNLEISPIRKKVSDRDDIIANIMKSCDLKSESTKVNCDIKRVTKKLPFFALDSTSNKTVSSSKSSDSGIESMCKTGDSKIEFKNSLTKPGFLSPFQHLKPFPIDHSDILHIYANSKNSKPQQPYKYMCKEGLDQQSIFPSPLLDKNNKLIKSAISVKKSFSTTVDFLFELNLKNCSAIVSQILSYLPDEDLRKASNVCTDWKNIILNDNKANKRRSEYINNKKNVTRGPNKENRFQTKCQTERNHKSAFLTISNIANEVPKQPLYNDNLVGRFDSFCKEGKTLQEKEKLMKCPKCNYPSKIESWNKYCCTRNLCLHEFCKKCLGPFIDNHLCSEPNLNTSLPSIIIGSKKSKKNLRRL